MKVTIVTPTIRKEGLNVVHSSLIRQDYPDIEWLVGSPFDPGYEESTWVKDDFEGGYWSINRIYNRLFARATGDLIITWQDNIWIPSDGVTKFVALSEHYSGVFTGVGDQYERLNKWGKPEVKIWHDPRREYAPEDFCETHWQNCEWNWAAIPKKYLYTVGGMDEGLDFLGYGGDQYSTCERMDKAGVKFYIDKSNESFTVRHDRSDFGGQEEWDKNHVLLNGKYVNRYFELMEQKKWPNVGYLLR